MAIKMIDYSWRIKVTAPIIYHYWRHSGLLLLLDLNTNLVPSNEVELEELASLLEKLSLATQNPFQGVEQSMGASEYVKFELDFDLNKLK
jgi:hypothetical protein